MEQCTEPIHVRLSINHKFHSLKTNSKNFKFWSKIIHVEGGVAHVDSLKLFTGYFPMCFYSHLSTKNQFTPFKLQEIRDPFKLKRAIKKLEGTLRKGLHNKNYGQTIKLLNNNFTAQVQVVAYPNAGTALNITSAMTCTVGIQQF